VQSLKPSTQGLARIKQARQRITQEKGWAVDHPQWLQQASGFLPLVKNGKSMVPGTVGISTWKRFLAGEPVKPTNFKAFCQVLGLNWEDVVDADTVIRPQGGNAYEEASIIQHSSGEEAGENSIPNPKSRQLGRSNGCLRFPEMQVGTGYSEAMDYEDNCRNTCLPRAAC
jgi:hypothetical protein